MLCFKTFFFNDCEYSYGSMMDLSYNFYDSSLLDYDSICCANFLQMKGSSLGAIVCAKLRAINQSYKSDLNSSAREGLVDFK